MDNTDVIFSEFLLNNILNRNNSDLVSELLSRWKEFRSDPKPSKQPLFTTEDGKPIYEGDGSRNTVVFDDFTCNYSEPQEQTLDEIKMFGIGNVRIFSSEKNAYEYIKKNKPKYSEKDMFDLYYYLSRFSMDQKLDFKDYLKTLNK